MDDDRFVERKGRLLRVPSANAAARQRAVNFTIQQLGKPYFLVLTKPTSINQPRWQCALLV